VADKTTVAASNVMDKKRPKNVSFTKETPLRMDRSGATAQFCSLPLLLANPFPGDTFFSGTLLARSLKTSAVVDVDGVFPRTESFEIQEIPARPVAARTLVDHRRRTPSSNPSRSNQLNGNNKKPREPGSQRARSGGPEVDGDTDTSNHCGTGGRQLDSDWTQFENLRGHQLNLFDWKSPRQ